MLEFTTPYKNYIFTLSAIAMGNDWNISIYGGDTPHIGAVAVGIPRPSLKNPEKLSSSVSIITIIGHKEDEIMRQVASRLSTHLNTIVTVSGGIHLDTIATTDFKGIESAIDKLCTSFITTVNQ